MSSLILYHPIEGDVNATEVSVAIAKSKGKLCALRSCRYCYHKGSLSFTSYYH